MQQIPVVYEPIHVGPFTDIVPSMQTICRWNNLINVDLFNSCNLSTDDLIYGQDETSCVTEMIKSTYPGSEIAQNSGTCNMNSKSLNNIFKCKETGKKTQKNVQIFFTHILESDFPIL